MKKSDLGCIKLDSGLVDWKGYKAPTKRTVTFKEVCWMVISVLAVLVITSKMDADLEKAKAEMFMQSVQCEVTL